MAATNGTPSDDGEVTLYTPKVYGNAVHRSEPLFYVNGMATNPEAHRVAASMFADMFQHDVIGVYNLTGNSITSFLDTAAKRIESCWYLPPVIRAAAKVVDRSHGLLVFLADLVQCGEDYAIQYAGKVASLEARIGSAIFPFLPSMSGVISTAGIVARDEFRAIMRRPSVRQKIIDIVFSCGNIATQKFYALLDSVAIAGQTTRVVCHSQGNLITSNALAALDWVAIQRYLGTIKVYGLASPVGPGNWPKRSGFTVNLYTNVKDPVTWLSLGASYGNPEPGIKRTEFSSGSVGFGAHDINIYKQVPAFGNDVKADMNIITNEVEMTFPHYFHLFGHSIHPHLLMELIAYTGGFQIYLRFRKRWPRAQMHVEQNLWIIVGAIFGALFGSKILAWIESAPEYWRFRYDPEILLGGKTIVGGLLGGWIGVEIAKKIQRVRHSTGDAFVFPLIFGMAVGRIGCFLTGVADHTHGMESSVPWAIDMGDGHPRHPTQLYDIAFLMLLAIALFVRSRKPYANGHLFRLFLLGYVLWRFSVEFLKPRYTFAGLSAIQVACASAAIWLVFIISSRDRMPVIPLEPMTR